MAGYQRFGALSATIFKPDHYSRIFHLKTAKGFILNVV
jgi:hypothetical protein